MTAGAPRRLVARRLAAFVAAIYASSAPRKKLRQPRTNRPPPRTAVGFRSTRGCMAWMSLTQEHKGSAGYSIGALLDETSSSQAKTAFVCISK